MGRDERKRDNTKGEETSRDGTGSYEKSPEGLDVIKLIETRRYDTRRDRKGQDLAGRDETRQKFQDHGILEKK